MSKLAHRVFLHAVVWSLGVGLMAGVFLLLIGIIFPKPDSFNYEHGFQMLVVIPIIVTIICFVALIRVPTGSDLLRKRESITCECGKLAEPIDGTENRYRCEHCGRQFAGPSHSL